jgi:hypothetical protein
MEFHPVAPSGSTPSLSNKRLHMGLWLLCENPVVDLGASAIFPLRVYDPFPLLAATLSSTHCIIRSGNSVNDLTIFRALVGLRRPVYAGDSGNWGA